MTKEIMESIKEIEEQIISEFEMFDDWTDKYEHLIELGKTLPIIDSKYKTEDYLIKGCQSLVWLNAAMKDGKVIFTADSDAIITKGLIALLVRVLSNQKPEDIANAQLSFIDKINLKEHLSVTRSNGLLMMVKQMKTYAIGFGVKKKDYTD